MAREVSMQLLRGELAAIAWRPSTFALLLHRVLPAVSLAASSSSLPLASTALPCTPLTAICNPTFGASQVPSSSPGPGTSAEAPIYGGAKQSISGVRQRSSSGAVVSQVSPRPPYASPGKLNPEDDPFKGYGVPDQAVVEPWSNNISFRLGPMYGSPQPSSFNRLFVGNLAPNVDDATLRQLISRFGAVLEATILRDPESGRSRGFGVVAMASAQDVKAAFEALDGYRLDSRPLKVETVAL